MGYYSAWALVVHSEDEKALIDFEAWLYFKVEEEREYIFNSDKKFTSLQCSKDIEFSYPYKKGYVSYSDESTKCDDFWSNMLNSIRDYCDKHNLKWDYVRSGEELSDIEMQGSDSSAFIHVKINLNFNF